MPLFEYSALDARGKKHAGFVDAGTLNAARERLRTDGFFVVFRARLPEGTSFPPGRFPCSGE